jgi:hypothetical protein
MPTFIKTGFWDKLSRAPKEYLNLDLLLSTVLPSQLGNNGKYLQTDGATASWQTISLTGYVPYTGATGAVNLGAFGITAASIVKSGGTSSQFLKADGSVDSSGYVDLTTAQTIAGDKTFTGVLRPTVTTNRQIASYILAIADRGKLVEMNVAIANNLTIPLDSAVAFPIGTQLEVAQYGAGQTTIVGAVGVTIRSASGNLKIASQYVAISLIKIGTNEWYCFGNLSA